MNSMTRIFLLDDHKIIRDGIRSILNQSQIFQVVGEEGDPIAFMEVIKKLDIDILLLDITFPNISGMQIIPRLRKERPDIRIVVLSMHKDPEYMQRCLMLGAQGYISKDADTQELLSGLIAVREGKTFFTASETKKTKSEASQHHLSQRELEILRLLANGFSSKQIGTELSISTRTVETHRLNIMKKLNTSNSAETISVAVKMNLL